MLLSHPNKDLLIHLENTSKIGLNKVENIINKSIVNFSVFSNDLIFKTSELVLKLHDLGKATNYFQEYINDIQSNLINPRYNNSELKNHGLLSAVLAFSVSKTILEKPELSFLVFMLIYRHHSNLIDLQDYRQNFANLNNPYNSEATNTINSMNNNKILCEQFKNLRKNELNELLDKLGYPHFNLNDYTLNNFIDTITEISSYNLHKKVKNLFLDTCKYESFLLINYIFSILVYADKTEAIFNDKNKDIEQYISLINTNINLNPDMVDNYKNIKFNINSPISHFRETVYNEVIENTQNISLKNNKIYSINLPTGAGKTLIALKSALSLREKIYKNYGYFPKIIYAMPFTTIIDQNYDVFVQVLQTEDSRQIIKHHYLCEKSYSSNVTLNNKNSIFENEYSNPHSYDHDISSHLIESWDSELIVTTYYQFFHSVLTDNNKALKKFHNIIGSIVIFDEVQCLKIEYWNLIKTLLQLMAEHLNCYFIFMTATMPLIFSEKDNEITELATNKIRYFNSLNRIYLDVSGINEYFTIESLTKFLGNEIIEKKPQSILIVLNTVKSSIKVYRSLKEYMSNITDIVGTDYEFFYLSTNIIPLERKIRINEIKKNIESKKCACNTNDIENNAQGNKLIIVSTQMIEAGVDIDVDYVYRDIGPIDSINQTAGRCNRNSKNKVGTVKIFRLIEQQENSKHPREFCSYVYDKVFLEASEKVLKNHSIIEEKHFYSISQEYYKELLKISSKDKGNKFIESLRNLKYSDFCLSKDSFRIIEESFKTVDIFIQVDERSQEVWEKYQNIKKIGNFFERKKEFDSIKSTFLDYVISVPSNAAKIHFNIGEEKFIFVNKYMIENVYNYETGFIRDNLADFFF